MNPTTLSTYGSVLALACIAAGCKCSQDAPRANREKLAQFAPSASTAPSASALPAAQRIERPSATLAASVILLDPPFEHVGEQSRPLPYYVHRVRGATLVTRGDDIFKLDGDKASEQPGPGGLGGNALPSGQEIGPLWMDIVDVGGSWPNELWFVVSGYWVSDGARIYSPFTNAYHGDQNAASRVPASQPFHNSHTVAAWSNGRVLALEDGRFRDLTNPKTAVPKGALGNGADCALRVELESLAALPAGDVFAIGRGCGERQFMVEHWTEASPESKSVDALPPEFSTPLRVVQQAYQNPEQVWLLAASPSTAYALRSSWERSGGQARLARFDGTAWRSLALPLDLPIDSADVADDGSLWVVMGDAPYVFEAARGWRAVTLPPGPPLERELDAGTPKAELTLTSVAALGADRAYFGAGFRYADTLYERGAVLATASGTLELVHLPEPGAAPAGTERVGVDAGATELAGAPAPFTTGCSTPFVVLFSVSDAAPKDFAYPATRDALLAANVRPRAKFVEFSFNGHRTLGAEAADAEQAKLLVELISQRVKGSKPTLTCFAPASVIRQVSFP